MLEKKSTEKQKKMKSGVYQIRNLNNSKRYVGSAVTIRTRWNEHRHELSTKQHHSPKLQNAWTKHSASAFVFEVLLYCDPENCLMYEQIALDHYKPEYNICKNAGSPIGYKHTKEAKRKMTKRNLKRFVDPQNHPMYGKHHSDESKYAIAQTLSSKRKGIGNPAAKLNDTQVRNIKRHMVDGLSNGEIATIFKVSKPAISLIRTGKTWSHIQ